LERENTMLDRVGDPLISGVIVQCANSRLRPDLASKALEGALDTILDEAQDTNWEL
jgi:hypothetical protein